MGLITSLVINLIEMSKKKKNTRYTITNAIMKGLSNIIKEFEKLSHKGYVRNIPKHKPIDSYFYLSIQLAKCMMRDDAL